MPSLYKIFITGKLTMTVECVGNDNGDVLSDEMFVSRVYEQAGIDSSLKSFKASDFVLKIVGQRQILGL